MIDRIRKLGLALIPLFPVALCAAWFSINERYPTGDDAALQLFSGVRAYHSWRLEGVLSALHDLYFLREPKPVLTPVFAFPALVLTGGDIRAAVAVVNIVLLSTFLLILYNFLRLYLTKAQASIGTCLIGLLPWVMRSSVIYGNELPVMTASMASVYFLLQCGHFTSKSNCLYLGLSLGFALCFRPLVVAMGFGPAILVLSFLSIRCGTLKSRDVLMIVPVVVVFIMAAVFSHIANRGQPFITPHEKKAIAGAAVSLASVWLLAWGIMAARRKLSTHFFLVILPAALMAFLWFFPFFDKLYQWIETGAFSVHLKSYVESSRGKAYQNIFTDFGKYILLLTSVVILWRGLRIAQNSGEGNRFARHSLKLLVPTAFIPPIVGLFLNTPGVEYFYFYFTILYSLAVIVIFGAGHGEKFPGYLRKGYVLLGLVNALIVAQIIFQWDIPALDKIKGSMGYQTYNSRYSGLIPTKSAEPALSIAHQVSNIINHDQPVVVGYAAYVDMDHFELRLICLESGKNISFEAIWLMDVEDIEAQISYVKQSYQYVLFGPCNRLSAKKMVPVWNQRLYDFALELNERYKAGTLEASGFEVIEELWTPSRRSNLLLLQVVKGNSEEHRNGLPSEPTFRQNGIRVKMLAMHLLDGLRNFRRTHEGKKRIVRNAWPHIERGNQYRKAGEYGKAKRMFEYAIKCDPYNAWAYIDHGHMYFEMGDYKKAGEMFNAARRIDPENAQAYYELGKLQLMEGHFSNAKILFDSAIRFNPSHAPTYIELGNYFRGKGDYEAAQRFYEAGIKANPKYRDTYVHSGNLYFKMGEHSKAQQVYELAISVDPLNTKAYVGLGGLYGWRGDIKSKEMQYLSGIKAGVKEQEIYVYLGTLYEGQGRWQKAENAYRAGIEADPGGTEAYVRLDELLRKQVRSPEKKKHGETK